MRIGLNKCRHKWRLNALLRIEALERSSSLVPSQVNSNLGLAEDPPGFVVDQPGQNGKAEGMRLPAQMVETILLQKPPLDTFRLSPDFDSTVLLFKGWLCTNVIFCQEEDFVLLHKISIDKSDSSFLVWSGLISSNLAASTIPKPSTSLRWVRAVLGSSQGPDESQGKQRSHNDGYDESVQIYQNLPKLAQSCLLSWLVHFRLRMRAWLAPILLQFSANQCKSMCCHPGHSVCWAMLQMTIFAGDGGAKKEGKPKRNYNPKEQEQE